MKITPMTEKEYAENGLAPQGTYGFEIISAEEKKSKSMNDMFAIVMDIFDDQGNRAGRVWDYLVNSEDARFRIRQAARACGLFEKYESGVLEAEDFVRRTGHAKIVITSDKNGQYPDKHSVREYVAPSADTHAPAIDTGGGRSPPRNAAIGLDDEVPFAPCIH